MIRVPCQEAASRVERMGYAPSDYYRSGPGRTVINRMFMASPLLLVSRAEAMSLRFTDRAFPMVYTIGDCVYARKTRDNTQPLISFVRETVRMLADSVLLLTNPSDDTPEFSTDPWLFPFDFKSQRAAALDDLFLPLGITEGTACGLEASIPSDLDGLARLADWYWGAYGRNLYLFLNDGHKILICHEADVHVSSPDEGVMANVIECSKRMGLYVAPFDIALCM